MGKALAKKDPAPQAPSLLAKVASKYSVDPDKMMVTLKNTAFRTKDGVSNEQMMALLIVADQYNLNPWTKEIYAFEDKHKGIVPVVGVDGWARIINEDPHFDGMAFDFDAEDESCTCTIYRKDRKHPVSVTEYMSECRRNTGPWGSHPKRMLRHKAMIQCARLAFGFAGIYDQDEAERIVYVNKEGSMDKKSDGVTLDDLAARNAGDHASEADAGDTAPVMKGETIDMDTGEVVEAEGIDADHVEFLITSASDKDELDAAVKLIAKLPQGERKRLRELAVPLFAEFS